MSFLTLNTKFEFEPRKMLVLPPKHTCIMSKRKDAYGCENCESSKDKLKKKEYEWEQKVRSISDLCSEARKQKEYWQKRAISAEQKYSDRFESDLQLDSVETDVCSPQELQVNKMREYYDSQLVKHPHLKNLIEPLFSGHFKSKERARSTNSRWQSCAGLYRAFVADVILRTKNSKAVLRTNLLLGLMIYQSDCPTSIWRLLQRLKIIPTKDTVENYMKSIPSATFSESNFIITHYDNCDIYRHVVHKYTGHLSEYLHMVSRLVWEIPRVIDVFIEDIFKTYNVEEAVKFACFLLIDFGDQVTIAENASNVVTHALGYGGLKFAL